MTPAYASPEQVRGEPLTTASDIYSLGVLLYECICGQRPFDTAGLSLLEVERLLTTRRPDPPSARAEESGGTTLSDRDLDVIVLKAMHGDPGRRYASAGALEDDLAAYQLGQPVAARADTAAYRFRKLVQRHPWGTAAAVGFVLLLTGATVALALQAQRLAAERDRATLEATTAAAVSDFMVDLFQVSDPLESRERDVSARELLQRGAEKILTELSDAPQTQARLLQITAQSYANLGDYEAGIPLLQSSIDIRRRLGDAARNDLAESLNRLGNYRRDMGDLTAARELIGESVAIREALAAGRSDFDLADSYNNYGLLLYDAGRYEEAEDYLTRSLTMHRDISGNQHNYVGIALHNLALVAQAVGNYDLAEQRARESLDVKASVAGTDHPSYANTLELLSGVARRSGKFEEAARLIQEARTIKQAHYPPDHPRVLTNLRNEALLFWDQGDLESAATLLDTALDRLQGDASGRERYRYSMLVKRAELALDQGQISMARAAVDEARPIAVAIYGEQHDRYADWLMTAADVARAEGNIGAARGRAREAEGIYRSVLPRNAFPVLRARALGVTMNTRPGSSGQECGGLNDDIVRAEALPTRQQGRLLAMLAECYRLTGSEKAATYAQRADALLAETLPPKSPIRTRLRERATMR